MDVIVNGSLRCNSNVVLFCRIHNWQFSLCEWSFQFSAGVCRRCLNHVALTDRRMSTNRAPHRSSAVVALVLVSLWIVVRNLPFAPFTALYV